MLGIPGVGGSTLSTSHLGRFMVFVYIWLPFMILRSRRRWNACRRRCCKRPPTSAPSRARPSCK
ncbi:hypothetical protein [Pseudomonas sp. 11/12A]|uniref:hypothetical protein n=1 Tax=Pseudomonas sp. 11/12A TaxID=1506582 RepID=UPI000A827281